MTKDVEHLGEVTPSVIYKYIHKNQKPLAFFGSIDHAQITISLAEGVQQFLTS